MDKKYMERRYENTSVQDAVTLCPNCGGENEPGTLNCVYCGTTLVTVTRTEVEEKTMSQQEAMDAVKCIMRSGRDSMRTFTEELKEVNARRNPDHDKVDTQKRLMIVMGVVMGVVMVCGIGLLILIIFGTIFFNTVMEGMDAGIENFLNSPQTKAFSAVGSVATVVLSIPVMMLLMIVMALIFRKKKTTETVYEKQCKACGASNRAGSAFCAYCGSSLAETSTVTESAKEASDLAAGVASGAKDLILKGINAEYDYRDKKRAESTGNQTVRK